MNAKTREAVVLAAGRVAVTDILQVAVALDEATKAARLEGPEFVAVVKLVRRWQTTNGKRSEVTGLLPHGGFEIVIRSRVMPRVFGSARRRVPHGWTLGEGRTVVREALEQARRSLGVARRSRRVRERMGG